MCSYGTGLEYGDVSQYHSDFTREIFFDQDILQDVDTPEKLLVAILRIAC